MLVAVDKSGCRATTCRVCRVFADFCPLWVQALRFGYKSCTTNLQTHRGAGYLRSYNPFHCDDDNYMAQVNIVFGSLNLHDEFFAKHRLNYLADFVRVLTYTGFVTS